MKRQWILVFVVLAVLPLEAEADLKMSIISETYHVEGYVHVDAFTWYGTFSPTVDLSYSSTISSDPSTAHPYLTDGVSDPGFPNLYSNVLAGRGELVAFPWPPGPAVFSIRTEIGLSRGPWPEGASFAAYAYGSVQEDFMLAGTDNSLTVVGQGDAIFSAKLTDLTTLESWSLPNTIPINKADPYRFEVHASDSVVPSHFSDHYMEVEFLNVSDVTQVPVPGAVLLGGIGLSVAGWRLRRRTDGTGE